MHRSPVEGQGADDTSSGRKGIIAFIAGHWACAPSAHSIMPRSAQDGPDLVHGGQCLWSRGCSDGTVCPKLQESGILVPSVSQETQAEEEGGEGGQQGPWLLVEAGGL